MLVRGEHVSAIAAISTKGLLALKIVRGGVDGDMFYNFVCTELLPKLLVGKSKSPLHIVIYACTYISHVVMLTPEPSIILEEALQYVII